MKRCAIPLVIAIALMLVPSPSWGQDAEEPKDVDAALKDVATYEFGQSRLSLTVVADAVRDSQDSPEVRKGLMKKLIQVLEAGATRDGKDFACRQLAIIGTEEAVPVLAPMLTSEEESDMARYALERMPYAAVDKALLDALGKTSGKLKVGIINSLGERRCADAVTAVGPLAADQNPMIAAAAIASLGKIGGTDAIAALDAAKEKVAPELQGAFADAYMLCADRLRAAGENDKAAEMYTEVALFGIPQVRTAAFIGHAMALGEKAVPVVAQELVGGDPVTLVAAVKCVRQIPGKAATEAFAGQLSKMQPAAQVMLLSALADRGDKAALPAVTEAAESEDAGVRLAALEALGKLGDASCVSHLAQVAASAEKAERDIARNSLNLLRGADVDTAMLAHMKGCEPPVRAELVRSLAARRAVSAVPDLLQTATDSDEAVRVEALKALAELAPPEQMPALVDLLIEVEGGNPRKEAEKAVVAVAKKIADEDQRAAAVLAVLDKTKEVPARCSLLAVLGQIGDNTGLKPVSDAANRGKAEVQDAAVRALAGWPNTGAIDDLVAIAGSSKNPTHRVLSLRGLLRLLELPSDRGAEATLAYYEKAMKAAQEPDEKKMVLGGLANVKSRAALKLVEPCLDDEALKEEASVAARKIRSVFYKATASSKEGEAKNAFDGNMDSRWDTGAPQKGGEWFQIDLGAECKVSGIALDTTPTADDYPRGYEVFVSNDTGNWGDAVAKGKGSGAVTEIAFSPKSGRYVKIVQTGADETHSWSIHELTVDSREK